MYYRNWLPWLERARSSMICVCKQKNWKPGCNSGLVWRSENQGNWWCGSWSESKSTRIRGTRCVRTGENRSASFSKERTNLPAGGTVVKNPPANCKRHKRLGFDPWVWKTPLWSRKWQPTPLFLPLKSHRQRCLEGYSPWGCKESDVTERLASFHHPLTWVTAIFLIQSTDANDICDDLRTKEQIKPRRVLECQEQKNQTLIDLPSHPQWCNY